MCGDSHSCPSTSQLRPESDSTRYSRSRLVAAATALPRVTPIRAGSMPAKSSPLSCTASWAQTTANWVARSMRRISRWLSPSHTGSKSASPAICDRYGDGSKKLIRRVAVRPAVSRSQNSLVPRPPGARTPMPVMTTRRLIPTPPSLSETVVVDEPLLVAQPPVLADQGIAHHTAADQLRAVARPAGQHQRVAGAAEPAVRQFLDVDHREQVAPLLRVRGEPVAHLVEVGQDAGPGARRLPARCVAEDRVVGERVGVLLHLARVQRLHLARVVLKNLCVQLGADAGRLHLVELLHATVDCAQSSVAPKSHGRDRLDALGA